MSGESKRYSGIKTNTKPDSDPSDRERRAELRRFLRAHREALTPPVQPGARRRRRTPGLRREEVAELAGMSPVWYAWLEMGRPVQASAKILERVAAALQLSPDETEHLFTLAGRIQRKTDKRGAEQVLPGIWALIDHFPEPACVLGARLDLLATNQAYRDFFHQTDELEGFERNILWRIFNVPEKRTSFVDWRNQTDDLTALFRRNYAYNVGAPEFESLIEDLRASSAEFREAWERQHVMRWTPRELVFSVPGTGNVTMQVMYVTVPWDELQTIVFCIPKSGAH